jgi:hypothetical protein
MSYHLAASIRSAPQLAIAAITSAPPVSWEAILSVKFCDLTAKAKRLSPSQQVPMRKWTDIGSQQRIPRLAQGALKFERCHLPNGNRHHIQEGQYLNRPDQILGEGNTGSTTRAMSGHHDPIEDGTIFIWRTRVGAPLLFRPGRFFHAAVRLCLGKDKALWLCSACPEQY